MATFTPFYCKVSVIKGPSNKDPGNQTGDTLDVHENMENPGQYRKFYVLFKFVETNCSSCNGLPLKTVSAPSKRWFVHAKFSQYTHSGWETQTTYTLNLWDNHGQMYTYSYNARSSNVDPTMTIHEDSKRYPDPLPDIMIDYIKSNPFTQAPIQAFQTKLNHLYIPRSTVSKDLQELEELRKEVAELRKHSNSQQKEILAMRKGMEVLEETYTTTCEELKEQKSITKVLKGSLEALLDNSRTIEKEEVIDPVALPETQANPTQNNPFDTL